MDGLWDLWNRQGWLHRTFLNEPDLKISQCKPERFWPLFEWSNAITFRILFFIKILRYMHSSTQKAFIIQGGTKSKRKTQKRLQIQNFEVPSEKIPRIFFKSKTNITLYHLFKFDFKATNTFWIKSNVHEGSKLIFFANNVNVKSL